MGLGSQSLRSVSQLGLWSTANPPLAPPRRGTGICSSTANPLLAPPRRGTGICSSTANPPLAPLKRGTGICSSTANPPLAPPRRGTGILASQEGNWNRPREVLGRSAGGRRVEFGALAAESGLGGWRGCLRGQRELRLASEFAHCLLPAPPDGRYTRKL